MILFDGAMGTYYRRLYPEDNEFTERSNIDYPERIITIHKTYIEAGATAIKTNSFGLADMYFDIDKSVLQGALTASYRLAKKAAGSTADVYADFGPVLKHADPQVYIDLAQAFLDLGCRHFLFETQDRLDLILPAIRNIHAAAPDSKVIVSFAVEANYYTRSARHLETLLQEAEAEEGITYSGINCELGPNHLTQIYQAFATYPKFVYFAPNSGMPSRDMGRERKAREARYFAEAFLPVWENGVRLIGGCCGTEPIDIAALAEVFKDRSPGKKPLVQRPEERKSPTDLVYPAWYGKLLAGEKIIAVEYDTPAHGEAEAYLKRVKQLQDAGIDLLTIADNPSGRTRMDSAMTASYIQNTYGLEVIPHLTCRDRNLTAIHSLIYALHAQGVGQVLLVTGDPIPLGERRQVKAVFNLNSRGLMASLQTLNQDLKSPLIICGACNVNARRFDKELERTLEKCAAGMQVIFTQMVYTERGRDNVFALQEALAKAYPDVKVLVGIMPLVSQKNARFMKYEMSGSDISDEMMAAFEGLDRQAGELCGLKFAKDMITELAERVDGFYLVTPFDRVHLSIELAEFADDLWAEG